MTRENLARAAVERVLCLMAEGLEAVRAQGVQIGLPVDLPEPAEYVALGAARQAAGCLTGELPQWATGAQRAEADPTPDLLARYRDVRPWPVTT